MKAENLIGPASLVEKQERPYIGIRITCPFPGMFAQVSREWSVLKKHAKAQGLEEIERYFLRYYHCDMDDSMDVEIGLLCDPTAPLAGTIRPGLLPGGTYASLLYQGNGLRGNQALMRWARENGVDFQKLDPEKKESYVSRYEAYLADCRQEPRKLLWKTELAIKVS